MKPGEVIDRFVVEDVLGEGGIARVYRVRHRQLDTVHALKVLTLNSAGMAQRLLQEGKIQARLKHPHVVAVTDVVQIEDRVGLVMEFVEGSSLADALAEGAMETSEALELFGQVLSGVAAAHAIGVLHRDLKPGNILLTTHHNRVVAKVADFGIAKAAQEASTKGMTRAGTTMGTPGYMAPEQISDSAAVDARADVFALGAILYEMLTGKPAFDGRDVREIMNATCAGDFTPLPVVLPRLPANIASAVERALDVDPDRRFADCRAFALALNIDLGAGATLVPPELRSTAPAVAPVAPASTPRGSQPTWNDKAAEDLDKAEKVAAKLRAVAMERPRARPAPPVDTPRPATAPEPARGPTPRAEAPRAEGARSEPQRAEAPRPEAPRPEAARPEAPRATPRAPRPERTESGGGELRDRFGLNDAKVKIDQPDDPQGEVDPQDGSQVPDVGGVARGIGEEAESTLWILMKALWNTARFLAGPFLAMLAITWYLASNGAEEVKSLQETVIAQEAALSTQLSAQTDVIPLLLAQGADARLINAATEAYNRADAATREAKGRELAVTLSEQLNRLPPAKSQDEERARREIEGRLNALGRQAQAADNARSELSAAEESSGGKLAHTLGMVQALPEDR